MSPSGQTPTANSTTTVRVSARSVGMARLRLSARRKRDFRLTGIEWAGMQPSGGATKRVEPCQTTADEVPTGENPAHHQSSSCSQRLAAVEWPTANVNRTRLATSPQTDAISTQLPGVADATAAAMRSTCLRMHFLVNALGD